MAYQTVKAVEKAFSILELLTSYSVEDKPLTLAEISRQTGILPVTARNLLRTLEVCGYATRTGHGKYREGERCVKLFKTEGVLHRLREVAKPLIDRTVYELGESILLASVVKNRRVELIRSQSMDDTMVNPQWQANAKCYQMRTTRVLLAWFSREQLDSFLEVNGFPDAEDWPEVKEGRMSLSQALKAIQVYGGCCEKHGRYMAISVPVLTVTNEIVASLGCYALAERTDHVRAAGIFKIMQDCALTIQNQMTSSV